MKPAGHNNIKRNPVFRGMAADAAAFNKRKTVPGIGLKELLEAGVHFGHQTKRWNPKMKQFIFDARNGIHIIDLSKSVRQLDAACDFLTTTVRRGGQILFVGTKKQAQEAVREAAKACGQLYAVERWLGGTLTNFQTVKRSIARLKQIEKWDTDGTMAQYGKQEQSMYRREAARLQKHFEGIRTMERFPAAMFVVDIKREHNAVNEARRLEIPIVAIVDTNCDPDLVTYPIAGNDDAIRSVRVILTAVVQAISAGRAEYESKSSRQKPEETVTEAVPAAAPVETGVLAGAPA